MDKIDFLRSLNSVTVHALSLTEALSVLDLAEGLNSTPDLSTHAGRCAWALSDSEVQKSLHDGRRITAIKIVREKAQCSLAEAKIVIDTIRPY